MWLRDSTYQVNPYVPLAKDDGQLRELILGVINTQAEMIQSYPFANAYFPLKKWNSNISLSPPNFAASDQVHPPYKKDEVFEGSDLILVLLFRISQRFLTNLTKHLDYSQI